MMIQSICPQWVNFKFIAGENIFYVDEASLGPLVGLWPNVKILKIMS